MATVIIWKISFLKLHSAKTRSDCRVMTYRHICLRNKTPTCKEEVHTAEMFVLIVFRENLDGLEKQQVKMANGEKY